MTDKQIIVNGIDVSGCKYFDIIDTHSELLECPSCKDLCKNNPNCLYKQLKRKEQECERLKYNNDYEVAVLETTIDNLKEELEQERTIKEMYFTYYKAKHVDIKGKLFRYKQALIEIKEIAKWHTTNTDSEDIQNDMKQILQLISEAEL